LGRIGLFSLPSGISGDMFLGALVGAGAPLEALNMAVRRVVGTDLDLRARSVLRGGLVGTRVEVWWRGEPLEERGGPSDDAALGPPPELPAVAYADLVSRIQSSTLEDRVRAPALRVFRRLAETEAVLHGVEPTAVHFHELGSWDALADVVAAAAGVAALELEALYHGPIAVGGGTVRSEHGRLPVPAPVTLRLLEGRPCLFEPDLGELTTPTGAALLAEFAAPCPPHLLVRPRWVGEGAGRADLHDRPNLARLVIGEAEGMPSRAQIAVIEAALDDATPEEGGHLIEALWGAGARDVTLTPLIMKKSRAGFLLRVIADPDRAPEFASLMLRLSPSLGARWRYEERLELPRRIEHVRLPEGDVRIKIAVLPDGSERMHAEYEDLARIALERRSALSEVRREVERLWDEERGR
jgi:pyridinium-3,5-bisthiocarboxylic acid mononucleotide nickel chelatase